MIISKKRLDRGLLVTGLGGFGLFVAGMVLAAHVSLTLGAICLLVGGAAAIASAGYAALARHNHLEIKQSEHRLGVRPVPSSTDAVIKARSRKLFKKIKKASQNRPKPFSLKKRRQF